MKMLYILAKRMIYRKICNTILKIEKSPPDLLEFEYDSFMLLIENN